MILIIGEEKKGMKMQTQLCAICGWNLKEYYSVGDICPCCNNEYSFDDFLEKGEILENYCGGDREKLRIMAPELDGVGDEEYVANDIAWRFLRLAWVKNGCSFRYHKDEGIQKWTIEDAKKQLSVIGYKYDTLFRLAEEIIG